MIPTSLAIIGPGRVGGALAVLLEEAGCRVEALGVRHPEAAQAVARAMRQPPAVLAVGEATQAADIVLLTVKDEAIAEVAASCRFRRGAVLLHTCGSRDASVLAPARENHGCPVGVMHPLQSFTTLERVRQTLPGSCCFIEGDPEARAVAWGLAEAVGMQPMPFGQINKVLYHAAAIMSCNYVTTLMGSVERVARAAGMPEEDIARAFGPLAQATLGHVERLGAVQALTGPVARGDWQTVRTHLDALADALPEDAALYRHLAAYTARHLTGARAVPPALFPPTARRPMVGVMGSGSRADEPRAARVGAWLAEIGVHLLTGGGKGSMREVCRAFHEHPARQGLSIGILPARDEEPGRRTPPGYPNPWVDIPVYTHLPGRGGDGATAASRNPINILTPDVIVALPGSRGTVSEIELALHHGRPLIVHADGPDAFPSLPEGLHIEPAWKRVQRFVLDIIHDLPA